MFAMIVVVVAGLTAALAGPASAVSVVPKSRAGPLEALVFI